MTTLNKINNNQEFIGRKLEWSQIESVSNSGESSIVVVYGRRRVGKAELLERAFQERNILKFEGVEGRPEKEQQAMVMRSLAKYMDNPILNKLKIESWLDVFEAIYDCVSEGVWTVYFEELQWLSEYKDHFIQYLKVAWDNGFRRNNKLIIVLCGSSPSFMINHVLHSKALYNHSQHEIHLKPFTIDEAKAFLKGKSDREVMDAYLAIGGIPEYLKKLKSHSSVFSSICQNGFLPRAYFVNECERIFISTLKDSPHYRAIIDFLSHKKFATRKEISTHLKLDSGGRLSSFLNELELCGFIKKYVPYNLKETSTLARYCIEDAYLQFYFKFIKPKLNVIEDGVFVDQPTNAVNMQQYHQWLGYSFERFCRSNHFRIAKLLGFSGVNYRSGVYYNRSTSSEDPGYQIDLVFDRDDHVVTLCEIKYTLSPVGTRVISEFEKKCHYFDVRKTIHKVLISAEGADQALLDRHYFDAVITLSDIMDA